MITISPTLQIAVVRRARIAVLALAIINFILMIALYSFQAYLSNNPSKHPSESRMSNLVWQDYLEIIFSVLFIFVYYYALRGLRFMPTFARMILLTIPAALLIYVSIYSMVQSTNKDGHGSAFKCGGRGRGGNVWCRLNWSSKFISAVLGFAVLYEIVLTLVWGPMEPRRNYLPRYSETANQQPIIHDGGKTGSTHGMIQYSQQPGLGEPAAAILGKNTLAPPEAGYPFPQQQVNLGDLNNTNNGNNTVNINANTQSLDIPPEVVYQYPAPQQYQYRSQHEQFKIPQPILTVIPTTSESTSQMAPR